MSAPPDRVLMRAVAEVMITEEKTRVAADRELEARIERGRERIDEYGNVIETRFLAFEHRLPSIVAAYVASLELKDGAPGPAGPPGDPGPPGIAIEGPPGPPGAAGQTMQWRGTHSDGNAYSALDVVARNGGSFVALKDNPGPCPGDDWQAVSLPGKRGDKGERGARGERGERGPAGERGPPGVGIKDILEENGLRILQLTDGREFVLEQAVA